MDNNDSVDQRVRILLNHLLQNVTSIKDIIGKIDTIDFNLTANTLTSIVTGSRKNLQILKENTTIHQNFCEQLMGEIEQLLNKKNELKPEEIRQVCLRFRQLQSKIKNDNKLTEEIVHDVQDSYYAIQKIYDEINNLGLNKENPVKKKFKESTRKKSIIKKYPNLDIGRAKLMLQTNTLLKNYLDGLFKKKENTELLEYINKYYDKLLKNFNDIINDRINEKGGALEEAEIEQLIQIIFNYPENENNNNEPEGSQNESININQIYNINLNSGNRFQDEFDKLKNIIITKIKNNSSNPNVNSLFENYIKSLNILRDFLNDEPDNISKVIPFPAIIEQIFKQISERKTEEEIKNYLKEQYT